MYRGSCRASWSHERGCEERGKKGNKREGEGKREMMKGVRLSGKRERVLPMEMERV